MVSNLGNLAATVSLNIDPFQQSARVLSTQMRSIDNALKANEASWKNNSNNLNGQKAQYTLTGKAVDIYSAQLESQRKKYEELKAGIGDVNTATADQKTQLLSAEAAVNKTTAELEKMVHQHNELGKQIAISESNWTKSGQALENFGDKVSTTGTSIQGFGDSWTKGVTVPITAGVGLVTKAAMDWETDFASVMKTNEEVIDSTGKVVYSYDELESGLRGLTSTYHSSHSKIAGVAEAAGQLGIETQNVVDFTETMIMLGETTVFNAEDAAFALARLANITGMPQTEFRKLGSSLVELGNNFAATEAEIGNLAMNLAAAGTQVGMTEGEILGFAAALSSVGIEAQAGGTAFSKVMIEMQLATEKGIGAFDELKGHAADQNVSWEELTIAIRNGGKELTDVSKRMGFTSAELKDMYKEADKAAGSLEDFANVAGMTNAEFANLFKENPAEAIMEFVVGLSKAEEQGTSTIKVLDDMGISEVRLRDALLRGANASDLFADSIRMGNQAYDEGTALSDEYAIRQETVAHKLGVVKNQLNDVAITMGGPFLDAFGSAINASKPFIEYLGEMATKFSELSPETQENIVKTLLYTAAVGPAASITGRFIKNVGDGISTIGSFSKKIGEITGTLKAKSTALAVTSEGTVALASEMTRTGDKTNWFTTSILGAKTGTGLFAKSVGLLTSPLGLAVGAIGLGAVAYQLWGKEALESSRRTREWGTDVGAVTHETLTSVKSNTEAVSGQFGMMAQGFEVNSQSMVSSVESIGQSIEGSLIKKIEGLQGLLGELPDNFDQAMKEMLQDEIALAENSLEIVQKNTQRISEIKARAAQDDRNLSISEAKIIQDLAKDTTRAYVDTLDISAKEKKNILDAMNGDVENATKEQSQAWLQALGEQRRASAEHSDEMRKQMEKQLEAMGYNLKGEFAQNFLGAWDEINKTTVEGLDAQMAAITEKYPELLNEVFLANGQLIRGNDETAQAMIAQNQKIVESAQKTSERLAGNATRNAEKLAWTADEANRSLGKGAEIWNSLVFDEKTGELKSNVPEVVREAAADTQTWNELRLLVHEADLDSNAKKVIGEAAIANGWWDGMAWSDKEAILQDEFSMTMFKALESSGNWEAMSLEAKTAFLYSNTPEVMAQTMFDLGLWEEFEAEIKSLNAENYQLLKTLHESEEAYDRWQQIPDETKEMLAENSQFLTILATSEETLKSWNDLPTEIKELLADNEQALLAISQSEESINYWNQLSVQDKHILAHNSDLLQKVFQSETSMNAWNALDPDIKVMLANNQDILGKVRDGTISVEDYNRNVLPHLKSLFGNNTDLLNKVTGASTSIHEFNRNAIPDTKRMVGRDEASGPARLALESVQGFMSLPEVITRTMRTQTEFVGPPVAGRATGDPYFQGGPVWLGDGGKKEPFLTPQGHFGISPDDWTLYDLPRGTKIWPSIAKMKESLPSYAKGTSFDDTAMSQIGHWSTTRNNSNSQSSDKTSHSKIDLTRIIQLLEIISRKELTINMDEISRIINEKSGANLSSALYTQGIGGIL
ncbi:phage tail tape measure protein [Enterococcus mundtii]|uniref:phage tail tape measure protein n=1 Tax=Enterococcus mundtii TaxID=53346 RepID=UPI001CF1944E|nr:phage tail tape measure protein [Enterococcus mundtii]MCA6775051.1 phage tail tape measure protein [Enterococcus mundtii]